MDILDCRLKNRNPKPITGNQKFLNIKIEHVQDQVVDPDW